MNWLAFMTRTDTRRVEYLLKAFGATLGGTILFALVAVLVFPDPEAAAGTGTPPPPFAGFVIFWPAVSTLLIWGVLEATRRITPTYWHAAAASALVFAGVFTLVSDIQGGLIFAWPYFMFSLTFLAWQLKSNLDGVVMTFALQAALNLLIAVFMFGPVE